MRAQVRDARADLEPIEEPPNSGSGQRVAVAVCEDRCVVVLPALAHVEDVVVELLDDLDRQRDFAGVNGLAGGRADAQEPLLGV